MQEQELRTVELPPMRVARFHGYGEGPEGLAFEKMRAWLARNGAAGGRPEFRVFGFNNPNPEPGTLHYGYDFWVELKPDSKLERAALEQDVEIVTFEGGRYAALRHEGPPDGIPATWKRLFETVAAGPFDHGHHQWLEETFLDLNAGSDSSTLILDCLAPIR